MATRSALPGRNRLIAALSAADQSLLNPHLETLALELGTLLHETTAPIKYASSRTSPSPVWTLCFCWKKQALR
jgi:hypothetical protein